MIEGIYEQVSARGLMQQLYASCREFRPKLSRNTVLLALKNPTTPTRRKIIEEAKKLLGKEPIDDGTRQSQ